MAARLEHRKSNMKPTALSPEIARMSLSERLALVQELRAPRTTAEVCLGADAFVTLPRAPSRFAAWSERVRNVIAREGLRVAVGVMLAGFAWACERA
jgi:hypothetical protein